MPTSKPIARRFDTGSDKDAIIPTGGGEFAPSGFIAPWSAGIVTRFYTKSDQANDVGADFVKHDSKGGAQLYYKDYTAATEAAKHLGEGILNSVWRFQARVSDVLNIADKSKFQSPILAFDCDIASLVSKRRHAYHQIALPMAVYAVARGYDFDVPVFDISELTDRNTIFNDEFYAKMVGNPDANPNEPDHWLKSVLWQRRAALWAALGEPDPMKHINPEAERGRENLRTNADDLIECLKVVNRTWVNPQWARIVNVNDPKPDAVLPDGRRLTIPVVYELFHDRSAAEAAATALQGDSDEEHTAKPASAGSEPPTPSSWAGLGTDTWMAALGDAVASGKNLPTMMRELDVSKNDVEAWRAYMKL